MTESERSGLDEEVTTLVLELPGSFKFKAFGATSVDVSIKNMSSRKIMSVRDDILNSADTLLLFLIPIIIGLTARFSG